MLGIAERAHAADGMSGQMLHIIRGEHFAFIRNMLELAVVDLHIPGSHDEDCSVFLLCIERERLGDARRLHAYGLRRQFTRALETGNSRISLSILCSLK